MKALPPARFQEEGCNTQFVRSAMTEVSFVIYPLKQWAEVFSGFNSHTLTILFV